MSPKRGDLSTETRPGNTVRITLKIDVDTLRGTLDGVPALVDLLGRHGAQATFLFSLGPDNTGRALKRVFRPGFLKKVFRTSVTSNYGLKTLMYGVLIPGPDIAKRGAGAMRVARDAGFEVGIHTYDHIRWQDYVTRRDAAWTRREMTRAAQAFEGVFGEPAKTYGAAGWQTNAHALALQEELGFTYCSDTRGTTPFMVEMGGRRFHCPQLPTTLPTLDELVGREGITLNNVADHLLRASAAPLPCGHVFTLHAELEGMAYLGILDRLLAEWRARGDTLGSLGELYRSLNPARLPTHELIFGRLPGRSGTVAMQGEEREPIAA